MLIATDDRVVGYYDRNVAERLVEQERASVVGYKGQHVSSIRLTSAPVQTESLGLWAGSYGIDRVHSEHGVYFQHHNAYGELAVA